MNMRKVFKNRGVTIDALIVRNGNILLVKRTALPYKNYWALPGGYIEFNETAEQACMREIKEETNIKVGKLRLLNVYSSPKRHPKQVITIVYVADAAGVPRAGDDAGDVRWFPLKKLPKLAFDHGKIINDYKSLK